MRLAVAVRTFQLFLARATVGRYALEASCQTRFLKQNAFFAGRGVSHGGSRCDAECVV